MPKTKWKISKYDDHPAMIVLDNGKEVETVIAYAYAQDVGDKKQKENALLIAKVPEMFRLLKESFQALVTHSNEANIPEKSLIRKLNKLITEIEKHD